MRKETEVNRISTADSEGPFSAEAIAHTPQPSCRVAELTIDIQNNDFEQSYSKSDLTLGESKSNL